MGILLQKRFKSYFTYNMSSTDCKNGEEVTRKVKMSNYCVEEIQITLHF